LSVSKVGKVFKKASKYDVGLYKDLLKSSERGVMDAHHVGQTAAMKKFIPDFNRDDAAAILVPSKGHTIRDGVKTVSRKTTGFGSPRDIIARDIKELRRVYPDIPKQKLRELIDLNKKLHSQVRYKVFK
jgi:hypothetical protein